MHPIGQVLHISKDHMLVLVCEDGIPQKEHMAVFTEQEKRIGVVSDIFGPVKKPYATVRPEKGVNLKELVGKKLCIK